MKVLIVDDEKLARERLVRMVGTLEDYEVVGEAASGQEAILRSLDPPNARFDFVQYISG